MKKILSALSIVILGLVVMFSLVSCGEPLTTDGGKIIYEGEPTYKCLNLNDGTPYEINYGFEDKTTIPLVIYEIVDGEKYYYDFNEDEVTRKVLGLTKKTKERAYVNVNLLVQYEDHFEIELTVCKNTLLLDDNGNIVRYNDEIMWSLQVEYFNYKFNNNEIYYELLTF